MVKALYLVFCLFFLKRGVSYLSGVVIWLGVGWWLWGHITFKLLLKVFMLKANFCKIENKKGGVSGVFSVLTGQHWFEVSSKTQT